MPRERQDFAARLRDVPHKPGVYVMRDRLDHVIYVGKARDLRKRLSSYFTPGRMRKADLKTRALLDSVWSFEWHLVRSEPEALLFEGKLIKEFRPKYNVSFRDDKRFLLVRVHLGDPFPRFQLTRLRKEDGARYFGPFAHSGALRATLNAMKKRFGLRSCRPVEPGEKDYRHCLDHVIKNCSAPCIGRISSADYLEKVRAACEFLEGESRGMMETIDSEMRAAAAALDFEKAAQLRNLLEDLRKTTRPMTRFTRKSLPTTIDPEQDMLALKDALRLESLPIVMECFDISNITSTHIVASMVRFKRGVPDKAGYRRYRIRTVKGQDDYASMAEVVRRRYRSILKEATVEEDPEDLALNQENPEEFLRRLEQKQNKGNSAGEESNSSKGGSIRLPDLVIVDGGRGQLSMACRELRALGLANLPVIGLAKEFEEIYRPTNPLPMRLPEDSGALLLLQRIRDEAHRFANGYHSLLLKKRMSESLLDEIPGVSPARKKILLRVFKSVDRLKTASAEEVAGKIAGWSVAEAQVILDRLNNRVPGDPSAIPVNHKS
jgi:excinuclease ABC subunit C